MTARRHALKWVAAGLALGGLGACANLGNFAADVATFGTWPAGRAPGSYAIERLPSQESNAEQAQWLEAAVKPALERAGFKPVAAGAQPDVLVQVGARISRAELSPWDDPAWWRGGFGYWRRGPWVGPHWHGSLRYTSPRYDREVAVLLRDRETGKPLYEARASSESWNGLDAEVLGKLYAAALMDFPATGINPRQVMVPLGAAAPAAAAASR